MSWYLPAGQNMNFVWNTKVNPRVYGNCPLDSILNHFSPGPITFNIHLNLTVAFGLLLFPKF